jgi:hypothetical protein
MMTQSAGGVTRESARNNAHVKAHINAYVSAGLSAYLDVRRFQFEAPRVP